LGDADASLRVIGLFGRLQEDDGRRLQRVASLMAVVLLAAIAALGLPLRTSAAPLGIVSLQFAGSPGAAEMMLDSWRAVPRARLLWAHGLDLLLPVAYVIAIGTTAARAGGRVAPVSRWSGLAAGSALVAGSADQLENIAMGFTILGTPSWAGVMVTLVAATVKSLLLIVAVIALGVTLVGARRPQEASA